MLSTFYTVQIAEISGTGANAGFIDAERVEYYMANAVSPSTPNTLQDSINKVCANIRYKNLVENLQLMANMYVSDIQAPGADANTPPTSFTFTVEVERGDSVLVTQDELNAGQYIEGSNAIVRCVSRGLCETRENWNWTVYDPTPTTSPSNGAFTNSVARAGARTMQIDVGALCNTVTDAATFVTVSRLTGGWS